MFEVEERILELHRAVRKYGVYYETHIPDCFERIGSGWYARVFKHIDEPGVVYRVTGTHQKKCDPWVAFAKVLLDRRARGAIESEHIPRVLCMAHVAENLYVAAMEELSTCIGACVLDIQHDMNVGTFRQRVEREWYDLSGESSEYFNGVFHEVRESLGSFGLSWNAGATPDVHSGNIMYRGSTPVVTDPLS